MTFSENMKCEINLANDIFRLYFEELTGIKLSLLIILFLFKEWENLQ